MVYCLPTKEREGGGNDDSDVMGDREMPGVSGSDYP